MTILPHRQIGPFQVSSIGLGCMNLSHAYGAPPSPQDGGRLLNRALDLGVTLLDTAALYGGGNNERLVGRAVGHRRSEYVLASKCVLDMVGAQRVLDGSPAAITASLERSLQRLGVEHIDLFYLHRLDKRVPIEDSVGALARAVEAGKIGAIGLSEMSAATLERAHAVHPIAAVQTEYSPMVRNPEVAVLDACRRLGVGFVAFSPVARGLLAGAIKDADYAKGDIRARMPRFVEPNLSHNLQAVRHFNLLAAEQGLTPAQLSLAWTLARGEHVVPIPGTTNPIHLEENIGAASLILAPDVVNRINVLFKGDAVHGPRYPAEAQAQVDTELLPGETLA
ncbi:aldo/keto reductase [Caulobacter sp. LARHSG274]